MDLIFHPKAAKDAREIAARYAAITEGLKERFWKEFDDAIDKIAKFPERHHFRRIGPEKIQFGQIPLSHSL